MPKPYVSLPRRNAGAEFLTAAALTPSTGLLLDWGLNPGEPTGFQIEAVLLAGALLVAGQLLLAIPAARSESPMAAPLVALYLGVVCLVLLWPIVPEPALAARLALAVGVLTFFFIGCIRLLGRWLGCIPVASVWVLSAAALSGAAPLWAGPLLELPGSWHGLADPLLAASPFTYLAAMADWDFLRHGWFYRHTPLGGLRFHYPDPLITSAVYIGLALLCYGTAGVIRGRQYIDRSNPVSLNQA